MRPLLSLLLLLAISLVAVSCDPPRRGDDDTEEDDDDASDDDDDTSDDDDASDDDDSASSDDDDASDDDDVVDDDDSTPDLWPYCMLQALSEVEDAGILPAVHPLGDLAAQTLYSCETYQLLGVNLLSTGDAMTSSGSLPVWNLQATPSIAIGDSTTPATISLTGCNPYTCNLYTNSFPITATTSVTMNESTGPGNVPMIDVIFGTVSHNAQGQLVSNSIITGCSLGNLNEDLQANGIDIFDVLVNDINPHIGVAMQLHLYDVEIATEAASIECLAGGP